MSFDYYYDDAEIDYGIDYYDGGYDMIDYDQDNLYGYDYAYYEYDTFGELESYTTFYDADTYAFIDYDEDEFSGYSYTYSYYDAGVLDYALYYYDVGGYSYTDYNIGSDTTYYYDTFGRVDYSYSVYDDGAQYFVDYDQADIYDYDIVDNYIPPTGAYGSYSVTYDDGFFAEGTYLL